MLVAHDITFGGMENACAELILRGRSSVDFTVVSTTLRPDLRELVSWHRVGVVRRPFPLKFLHFFFAASVAIRRLRGDLVHTVGAIVPNSVDIISVQHCQAGVRYRTGGLATPGMTSLRRLNSALGRSLALAAERWCYRQERVRVLAASSNEVAHEIATYYSGPPVILTPNGVDSGRFAPSADVRDKVRRANGVRHDDVVVLFLGGDWDRKGLRIAIEGLATAERQVPGRLVLWVVGRGNQERFRLLSEQVHVGKRVRFFRSPSDVVGFYQAADIFVLPSIYEGFSLPALEAAASGLPVVSTRVGIVEELIGNEEAGLIVERNPQAVGDALARLGSDIQLRGRMGKAARHRALPFTWDRSVESVLEAYRTLQTGSQRPVDAVTGASRYGNR